MGQLWDRTKVKLVVIHHLGDGLGPCQTEAELRRRTTPAGYDGPAYDFGVLASGKVITLRSLTQQGAHCMSDRAKYDRGYQWWNRNSASVVLANSNDKFQPPEAMVQGLICFLVSFCDKQGFNIMDGGYPHFQVSQTACPGASYRKLGFNTGYLDYDRVEQSVNARTIMRG
jgi:hypothetical protein